MNEVAIPFGISLNHPLLLAIITRNPREDRPMADITDEQFARLEQQLAEASPLRWSVEQTDTDITTVSIVYPRGTLCAELEDESGAWDDETRAQVVADLTLAAEARNLLPAILAELRRHRGPDRPIVVS
jgi:hypothetical protein